MKAYGLARTIMYALGANTYVREEDEERNIIEIHSTLEPHRLRQLQALAEAEGWEVGYRCQGNEQLLELTET